VVRNFESIAKASEELVTTDLPASELGRFAQLAMKARSQPVSTVSFVPPTINTGHPDIDKVHAMVQSAVDRSEGKASAKGSSAGSGKGKAKKGYSRAHKATVGGSIGNIHEGYAANEAADLSSAC
jgi:polyisoprenyl-teichoic acid--peptidoglycan teichoic acid transferase